MADIHTPATVKGQLQADIAAANAITGKQDATIHDVIKSLIEKYGVGNLQELTITENGEYIPPEGVDGFDKITVDVAANGRFPELIYETTFEIEETLTENGVVCTISNDVDWSEIIANQEHCIAVFSVESYSNEEEAATTTHGIVRKQMLWHNQGGNSPDSGGSILFTVSNGSTSPRYYNQQYWLYISSRLDRLSSTLTVSVRPAGNTFALAGTYNLKIYRMGFRNAKDYTV